MDRLFVLMDAFAANPVRDVLHPDMHLTPGISVVVPVYNGEDTLVELTNRLFRVLNEQACPFELILVNDGSADRSWEVITNLVSSSDRIIGINHMRNFGQHNALLTGIRSARYLTTITMDDDLQNPPEEIPKLLEVLKTGSDVVYGVPVVQRHGLLRDVASQAFKFLMSTIMGSKAGRNASAYRAFHTNLRDGFRMYQGPWVQLDILLTWSTGRFGYATVDHVERSTGRSGYTFGKLVAHALNSMTGLTALPLQFASVIGFSFTAFGMLALAYVLIRYFVQGGSVPGFTFLAAIIAIFSGAQLFALGIIGEYLARMHFRIMGRASATVRQVITSANLTDVSSVPQPQQH